MTFLTHKVCALMGAAVLCSAAPAAAQDWSGAYYGATLGFTSGSYSQGVEALDEVGVDVDVNGLLYAGHAGVNIQNGALILGMDVGLSSGPSGETDQGTDGLDFNCTTGDCFVDINAIGTLRGRVGLVTDIRTYVYGAAGVAIASVEGGIRNSPQECSSTATGTTYAIGVERITSPFSSIFAEVGYYDLGTLSFGSNENAGEEPPESIEDFTAEGDFYAIRVGINYKF